MSGQKRFLANCHGKNAQGLVFYQTVPLADIKYDRKTILDRHVASVRLPIKANR